MSNDIFPSKLALGDQFCNRVKERRELADKVSKVRHTVLVSPRRYGKSSLVYYVISELKLPFVSVDLFLAHDDKTVTKRILEGISASLSQILPASNQTIEKVKKIFSKFHASLNLGLFQIELMNENAEIDAVDQIYSALTALESMAVQEKKKMIIFIDEFQDIAVAQSARSIQGAIRHVAQASQQLMFIFSGSNRHLLETLFNDKSMPLYMLCDKIYLERMSSQDYQPHLQKLAIKKWKKELSEPVLQRIFSLTELHPFYVNLLCHKVWQDAYPTTSVVEACWEACTQEEIRRIRAELEKLSRNQQTVMKALALEPTTAPSGLAFSIKAGIAISSLHQAIKALYDKDMVYEVKDQDPLVSFLQKGQVRVLDPLISYYLKKYS